MTFSGPGSTGTGPGPGATTEWYQPVHEPGNIFFEWSRSVTDPHEYVLVEAFTDDGAGPHVNSDHFKTFIAETPEALARTPKIVSRQVDGAGWDAMGELQID